jgi:TetR/AcrR family transcriptional regulator, transcriptional repressor for nem operon
MVALPADVTRSDRRAKRAFETVFAAMVSLLEKKMSTRDTRGRRNAHTVAQATAALCIGGMVVSRAMENRATADSLRDACMGVALELGGWREKKAANNKARA